MSIHCSIDLSIQKVTHWAKHYITHSYVQQKIENNFSKPLHLTTLVNRKYYFEGPEITSKGLKSFQRAWRL